MGYLDGRVTYERLEVGGHPLANLTANHVDLLRKHAVGSRGSFKGDGVEFGFTAGHHLLDLDFGVEKNVVNDALVFGMRLDSHRVPGDLKRAYIALELQALAAHRPNGKNGRVGSNGRTQRVEAKSRAEDRWDKDIRAGKFAAMKQLPALWDTRQRIVYLGSTSPTAIERFTRLFREAFHRPLTRVSAGQLAHDTALAIKMARAFEDLAPSAFTGSTDRHRQIAWIDDLQSSRDFLGNEFLLWLWWTLDAEATAIRLPDDSLAQCTLTRTLDLEDPLAERGRQTISSDNPTDLPEAKRAVQFGKLPRRVGLTVTRHAELYTLTLQAESLAVLGAALPRLDKANPQAEAEDRVDQIRHLTETLDLLYAAFCRRRLSAAWHDDLRRLRAWIQKD